MCSRLITQIAGCDGNVRRKPRQHIQDNTEGVKEMEVEVIQSRTMMFDIIDPLKMTHGYTLLRQPSTIVLE